jgi:hypothetical protein
MPSLQRHSRPETYIDRAGHVPFAAVESLILAPPSSAIFLAGYWYVNEPSTPFEPTKG